jgi:type IV pilus assembly protein PilY1
VTTAPELGSIFEINASYRFVYVGTGQYLADSDVTTTATQTMYGLVDDLSTTPTIDPLRSNLQKQELGKPKTVTEIDPVTKEETTKIIRTATSEKFFLTGKTKKKGWYIDLSVSGERVSTDPQLSFGSLVFTSNIPSGVACVPGGSSFLNILDYRTGGALAPGVLSWSSKFLGEALASRPVLVQLPSGEVRALIRLSNDSTITEGVPSPPATPKVRRVSWRELPDTSK